MNLKVSLASMFTSAEKNPSALFFAVLVNNSDRRPRFMFSSNNVLRLREKRVALKAISFMRRATTAHATHKRHPSNTSFVRLSVTIFPLLLSSIEKRFYYIPSS